MFEEFSGGYYLGRFYVQPGPSDRAVIHSHRHEQVCEALYDGTGPLVMKLDGTHIAVHGDSGVPEATLLVPDTLFAQTRIRNPPSLEEVLLAKFEYARQLLQLSGQSFQMET